MQDEIPDHSPIFSRSGPLTANVHHVDLHQHGMPLVCSGAIVAAGDAIAIIDIGTSSDVGAIISYLKEAELDIGKVKYLVPSHYHFDHFGGGWCLYSKIAKHNPGVKILATKKTMVELQDPEAHLKRARRTFGDLVGRMKPLPEQAYEIVEPESTTCLGETTEGQEITVQLVPTPGHCPDHCSPSIYTGGELEFIFSGEAAGTLFHSNKLVTLPTSMPPDFSYDLYMEGLERLVKMDPPAVAYCHFGAVRGRENVRAALKENQAFTKYFRDFVKKEYERHGETRPVVEKFIEEEINNGKRTDWPIGTPLHDTLVNIIVAVIYGQLVDLGLKDPK